MSEPSIVLARHGDTEWTQTHQHTGTTDLPLLAVGEENARALAPVLAEHEFARVYSSPLKRAHQTAVLAGFGDRVELADDLVEWNYGDFEGLTTPQIVEHNPGWNLWFQGVPNGESPDEVAARADRMIERALGAGGDVLMFAHGHILRVLAARWVGQGPEFGARLYLAPATVSRLGHEHGRRVIDCWNSTRL